MSATLSPEGRQWASAHADDSITARIALVGHASGWPEGHVSAAITTCNEAGKPTDLAADVADALTPRGLR